jgi:hypothetical protein
LRPKSAQSVLAALDDGLEAAIVDALSQRGGASSLWIDYVFAQVKGGVVAAPEFSAKSG